MAKRIVAVFLSVILMAGTPGVLFAPENVQAKKALPKKIVLSRKTKTLTVGDSYKIAYKVKGKKKANKKVLFTSSKKKTASVSKKGVVKAKKAGTAVITLRAKAKKSVRNTITIKVKEETAKKTASLISTAGLLPIAQTQAQAPVAIQMPATLELEPGQQYQMEAKLEPATAEGEIRYSCSFRGGINVYSGGQIIVTDDTPPGTQAVIVATCGRLRAAS